MEWYGHATFSSLAAFIYLSLVFYLGVLIISPLTVVAFFLYDLPDSDTRKVKRPPVPGYKVYSKHRYWFWHSSILPMTIFLLGLVYGDVIGCGCVCVVVGMHLLCDLKVKERSGFYLIYVRKGNRMNARNTSLYLALNGMLCIGAALLSLLCRNV